MSVNKTRFTDLLDKLLTQASEQGWQSSHALFKSLTPDEVHEYVRYGETMFDEKINVNLFHPTVRLALASKLLFSLEEDGTLPMVEDLIDSCTFPLLQCNRCAEVMTGLIETMKDHQPYLTVVRDCDLSHDYFWHLEEGRNP